MQKLFTSEMISKSPEDTVRLAAAIGRQVKGGEIIELVSDLGGGKTTFVRGLAEGMGSTELVHSPSFTVSNSYKAGKLWLNHFDFYRLDEPGILRNELEELLNDPAAVVVIEWANIVEDVLPLQRLTVKLRATDEMMRTIRLTHPAELSYLTINIQQGDF